MAYTVLISDPIDPIGPELLEANGITVNQQPGASPEELREHVRTAHGWIVRSGTTVTADLIEAAEDLKVIGRAGVGVDNIDLDAATRKGVLVANAPDGNTISTAEHTCAMLQALARRIPQANASLRGGRWDRKAFYGAELYDKTLGIVGLGKVGRAVAERMQGYGMELIAMDPVVSEEVAARFDVELVDLDGLIDRSDFITVHAPLNEETRGMFGAEELKRCKPGVRIVNCARGGIVDEQALLEALSSERVAGAALDVYSQEPPPDELEQLIQHSAVVATPHIAASTGAAQAKVARQITEQVIHALEGEPVSSPVNSMAIKMAAQPEVQPYLELADRLGQIVSQLGEGHLQRLTVRCQGEVPHRYTEVIAMAGLQGALRRWAGEPVNLINAPVLADEMGLQFTEERDSTSGGSYTNLLEVTAEKNGSEHVVAGTVFNGDDPRLVRINDFDLEVQPEGELLFYQNVDRPGMLATVGGLLADADINIGALTLGRKERGAMALTAISVDDAVPEAVLQQIAGLEGVEGVRAVRIR